jgi:hypothetical protein
VSQLKPRTRAPAGSSGSSCTMAASEAPLLMPNSLPHSREQCCAMWRAPSAPGRSLCCGSRCRRRRSARPGRPGSQRQSLLPWCAHARRCWPGSRTTAPSGPWALQKRSPARGQSLPVFDRRLQGGEIGAANVGSWPIRAGRPRNCWRSLQLQASTVNFSFRAAGRAAGTGQ